MFTNCRKSVSGTGIKVGVLSGDGMNDGLVSEDGW